MLPTANPDHVLSYVHGRALEAWEKLHPYTEQERLKGRCDTYWSYFENLARLAAGTDKRGVLDRLGLRRFDGRRWVESATFPAGDRNNGTDAAVSDRGQVLPGAAGADVSLTNVYPAS